MPQEPGNQDSVVRLATQNDQPINGAQIGAAARLNAANGGSQTTKDEAEVQDGSQRPVSDPDDGSCSTSNTSNTVSCSSTDSTLKRWGGTTRKGLLYLVGPATLIIAVLTLWPTIASNVDGETSEALALWTAKKDFLEYCADETQAATNPNCALAHNITLPPPPHFIDNVKRSLEHHVSSYVAILAHERQRFLNIAGSATAFTLVICFVLAACKRPRTYTPYDTPPTNHLSPDVHVHVSIPKSEVRGSEGMKRRRRKPISSAGGKTYELMHDSWESPKPTQQCKLTFHDSGMLTLAFGGRGELIYEINASPRNIAGCNLTWAQLNQFQLKLVFQRAQRYDMLTRNHLNRYDFWARDSSEAKEIVDRVVCLMADNATSQLLGSSALTQEQMLLDPFFLSSASDEDEEQPQNKMHPASGGSFPSLSGQEESPTNVGTEPEDVLDESSLASTTSEGKSMNPSHRDSGVKRFIPSWMIRRSLPQQPEQNGSSQHISDDDCAPQGSPAPSTETTLPWNVTEQVPSGESDGKNGFNAKSSNKLNKKPRTVRNTNSFFKDDAVETDHVNFRNSPIYTSRASSSDSVNFSDSLRTRIAGVRWRRQRTAVGKSPREEFPDPLLEYLEDLERHKMFLPKIEPDSLDVVRGDIRSVTIRGSGSFLRQSKQAKDGKASYS
ncbi:MAG: hypothetical protein Q9157_006127 [Trypethelium eluteriae]